MDQLYNVLETVCDEETFLIFLIALRENREASIELERQDPSSPYGPNALEWENTTIERFLDAAVQWGRSSRKGLPIADYIPPKNPWRRCADILYAAISYE